MKNQTLIRLHSVYCNYCLIAIALIFTSCGSIYYAPNQPHLPMIKEKGITKVNVQLAAGEYSSTMDINAVHSVTDHLGLMGNFASYYLDGNGMNTIDVGFGYYKPVSQHAGFEIYPGIGYGKLSVIDSWSGEYTYEVKSFRTFIQPDIFYETEHFGAALGLRVLYFKYQSHFQSYIGETPSNLMLEPTGCIEAGWEHFKFKLQATYSSKVNAGMLSYDPFMISFGFNLKFGNRHAYSLKQNSINPD